jgi:hypothetical protein
LASSRYPELGIQRKEKSKKIMTKRGNKRAPFSRQGKLNKIVPQLLMSHEVLLNLLALKKNP